MRGAVGGAWQLQRLGCLFVLNLLGRCGIWCGAWVRCAVCGVISRSHTCSDMPQSQSHSSTSSDFFLLSEAVLMSFLLFCF